MLSPAADDGIDSPRCGQMEPTVRDLAEYETLLTRVLAAPSGRHGQPFDPAAAQAAARGLNTTMFTAADGGVRVETAAGLQALSWKLRRGVLWGPLFDVAKWVSDYEQMSRMTWDVFIHGHWPMHVLPKRPLPFL